MPGSPAAHPGIAAAATQLGPLRQPCYVVARDNGASARYHGVSYWVFGDGFYEPKRCDGSPLDHAALLVSAMGWTTQTSLHGVRAGNIDLRRWRDLTDGRGIITELLPPTPDERRFNARHADCARLRADDPYGCYARIALFSSSIVADPTRDRLIVFFGQVCRRVPPRRAAPVLPGYAQEANCGSPWTDHGQSVAVVRMSRARAAPLGVERPRIAHAPDPRRPTLLWPDAIPGFAGRSRPHFESPVVSDGHLYAYSACPRTPLSLTCKLVARVALADVLDAAQWRYLSGVADGGRPRWDRDVFRASPVNGGGGSIAWVPRLRAYLTSPLPVGPAALRHGLLPGERDALGPVVSAPEVLFHGVRRNKGTLFGSFGAALHPEFAEGGGRTQYVTYWVPGAATGSLQFVRVAFTARTSP